MLQTGQQLAVLQHVPTCHILGRQPFWQIAIIKSDGCPPLSAPPIVDDPRLRDPIEPGHERHTIVLIAT